MCVLPSFRTLRHSTHLGLVPGLSFCAAAVGNVLVLGLDLSNDAVQVQAAVVVHGQDDGGVGDTLLHLGQLLQHREGLATTSLPTATGSEEGFPSPGVREMQNLRLTMYWVRCKVI